MCYNNKTNRSKGYAKPRHINARPYVRVKNQNINDYVEDFDPDNPKGW